MIAAVIPAFNAAETLGTLLERLARYVGAENVYVVDDGSVDATAAVAANAGAHVLHHPMNRGKGAALKTAFVHLATQKRYDAVLTIDADLQHDPADIPAFISEWQKGSFDLLVGVRKRIGTQMPLHRMLSNVITSFLVSARCGTMITDSQSGFRLISRRTFSAVETECDGFEAETEFLIRAALGGFRIGFVPVATIYGTSGSHMTHWNTTKRFLSVLLKEY